VNGTGELASSPHGARGPVESVTALLVPLVFTLGPAVGTVTMSAKVLPVHGPSIARVVVIGIAIASMAYAIARRRWDPVTASNVVALPLFLIAMYPAAYSLSQQFGVLRGSLFSIPYLAICVATGGIAPRMTDRAARSLHEVLRIVAAILLTFAISVFGRAYWWPAEFSPETRAAIDRISAPLALPRDVVRKPDVYHLMLDSMGRPDVLADRYGIDADRYLAQLRGLGFDVGRSYGHANYVQTHLSLSSMLNVEYLDSLVSAQGRAQRRGPLRELILKSRVPSTFRALGYEIEYIGSGYLSNGAFPEAERCDCPQLMYAESELGTLSLTPFEWLLPLAFGHRGHYLRSVKVFELFERARSGTRPRYVFAHTMLPHPPFVADENGAFTPPDKRLSGADASFFNGPADEYRRGYHAQATYALRRAVQSASRIIESSRREGRPAVVILTGDHGPRMGFDARQPTADSGLFALPVLLAIRWPEHDTPQESPRSLVNIYRSVFRTAFGMDLPPLPDLGYVSSFISPYAVTPVAGLDGDRPQQSRSDNVGGGLNH
jgi:Sulfatase